MHAFIHLFNKYLPSAPLGAIPAVDGDVREHAVSEGEAGITCEMTCCA